MMRRTAATGRSSCPRCTPSASTAWAMSGRSFTRKSAPAACASGRIASAAARSSRLIAGFRRSWRSRAPPAGEHRRPEQRVLELAHVPGPAVPHEQLARVLGDPHDRRPDVAVYLVDEELDQIGNVAAPIAERRHDDADDIQSEEEVVTE